MIKLLIANTVVLVMALVYCIFVTIMWFRAEKKLARFGQSILYKRRRK